MFGQMYNIPFCLARCEYILPFPSYWLLGRCWSLTQTVFFDIPVSLPIRCLLQRAWVYPPLYHLQKEHGITTLHRQCYSESSVSTFSSLILATSMHAWCVPVCVSVQACMLDVVYIVYSVLPCLVLCKTLYCSIGELADADPVNRTIRMYNSCKPWNVNTILCIKWVRLVDSEVWLS